MVILFTSTVMADMALLAVLMVVYDSLLSWRLARKYKTAVKGGSQGSLFHLLKKNNPLCDARLVLLLCPCGPGLEDDLCSLV